MGGRTGSMMETNYSALHRGILARLVADGTTTPETFEAVMETPRQEIATGRFTWPYYLAWGQRPPA